MIYGGESEKDREKNCSTRSSRGQYIKAKDGVVAQGEQGQWHKQERHSPHWCFKKLDSNGLVNTPYSR